MKKIALTEQQGTLRPLFQLALPVVAEQALGILVGFSDRVLAGHYLDTRHQAAMTLMLYLIWLTYIGFLTLGIGATALIARAVGAGRFHAAQRVMHQALLLGGGFTLVFLFCGIFWLEPFIAIFQLEREAAAFAVDYFQYLLLALPFLMISAVGIACLRGAGDMVTGLVIMSIVNIVNIALSWGLVLGYGPLPQLGWDGIAIGTMVAQMVGGCLTAAFLIQGRGQMKLRFQFFRLHRRTALRLLRTGLPAGVENFAMVSIHLWFLSIINQLGLQSAAAHGIAICIESIAFLPAAAFQAATSTLTGQYLGAKKIDKAARAIWLSYLSVLGMLLSVGVLLWTGAETLAMLFVAPDQKETAFMAAPLLQIISIGMPALAATIIFSGGLRGAGDTRWPLLFSVIGLLGVRTPLAYYLAFEQIALPGTGIVVTGCGLGVTGAWVAMVIDLYIRGFLYTLRIVHGGWKKVEV